MVALGAGAELLALSLAMFQVETSGPGAASECAEQPRAHSVLHSAPRLEPTVLSTELRAHRAFLSAFQRWTGDHQEGWMG